MPMCRKELSPFDYPPSFYKNAIAAHYDFEKLGYNIPNAERKAVKVGELLRVKDEMKSDGGRATANWINAHLAGLKIKNWAELRTLVSHIRSHCRCAA